MPVISDIQVVSSPEKKFPFLCPLCKKIDEEKEYVRIFWGETPQGECFHSECLKNLLKPGGAH